MKASANMNWQHWQQANVNIQFLVVVPFILAPVPKHANPNITRLELKRDMYTACADVIVALPVL
jgi:hypothetical protein